MTDISAQRVSGAVLAGVLGVTPRRVAQLRAEGVLVWEGRRYPLGASVQAYLAYRLAAVPPSLVDARGRFLHLKAEGLELDLAQRRGELVEITDAVDAWDAGTALVASGLDVFPQSVARELVGLDEMAIRGILAERLTELRERMADGAVDLPSLAARLAERGNGAAQG